MVKHWRYRLTVAATNLSMLLGLGTGVALSAPHCEDEGTSGCGYFGSALHTCCVDLDGDGQRHLANCYQDQFQCITPGNPPVTTYRWGKYKNCNTIYPLTSCT